MMWFYSIVFSFKSKSIRNKPLFCKVCQRIQQLLFNCSIVAREFVAFKQEVVEHICFFNTMKCTLKKYQAWITLVTEREYLKASFKSSTVFTKLFRFTSTKLNQKFKKNLLLACFHYTTLGCNSRKCKAKPASLLGFSIQLPAVRARRI